MREFSIANYELKSGMSVWRKRNLSKKRSVWFFCHSRGDGDL